MATLSPTEKAQRPAGIIGLSWDDINVSPHKILIGKEKAYFESLLKDCIVGMRELADKSAGVVAGFKNLETVLREGRAFFLNGNVLVSDDLDKTFSLRIASYEMGRSAGFEKMLKLVRRKLLPVESIGGESFQKEEFENALSAAYAFEQRRVAAVHRISSAMNDCLTRLTRDKNLQLALCAFTQTDDPDAFLRTRREQTQSSTRNLFEWLQVSNTVVGAFSSQLTFDGWFEAIEKLGALVGSASEHEIELSKPIGTRITPRRRAAIATAVSTGLDELANLARNQTTFPESPMKDVYRIHFLLGELEKSLPDGVANNHQRQLDIVTSRFIRASDALAYTIGVEQDQDLTPPERERFLNHIKSTLDKMDATRSSTPTTPSSPDPKRTEVRRERREEIQLEKQAEARDELLHRILEIKESSTTPRAQTESALVFFPARLEQEFSTWTDTFPEYARDGIKELLAAATRGDRVDSKPINIEKKMFELRLLGCGYRIYCTRSKNNELVVLGFGPKESQKQDILTAHGRFRLFCAGSSPA